MYAGSRRVLASLWKVDDEATGELMTRFYRGAVRERADAAGAALQAAQIELLRDETMEASILLGGVRPPGRVEVRDGASAELGSIRGAPQAVEP